MNSPFANIYLALQQLVLAQVTDIVYIDQDLGQLRLDRTATTRPAVQFPCLLIDYEDFSFENMGNLVQNAEGIIVFRLGFAPYSSSTATTPPDNLQRAISYFDIEWALHKALQGYSPGNDYGRLTRVSSGMQKRHDLLRVRELRYRIAFQDYSAKVALQYVPAAMVTTVQEITPAG
jgi:hypothetical protein